jgi:hypothetical protein
MLLVEVSCDTFAAFIVKGGAKEEFAPWDFITGDECNALREMPIQEHGILPQL